MHQIEIEFDVPAPMRDGTILRADVYRPTGEGAYPVIVQRTPYGKGYFFDGQFDVRTAVRRGYIVVIQDTRGRFSSDGEWLPWAFEREDGHDTIEWAASLPQSNGKVGMFGGSYLGSTQWNAALTAPEHLAAIAPWVTWSDPEDGLAFRGGAIELGLNTAWSLGQALGQFPKCGLSLDQLIDKSVATLGDLDGLKDHGYWELPAGLPPLDRTGQPDIGVRRALADPATTDESRIAGHYDKIEVPSLTFAGWYDVFQQGSLDNYIGMRAQGRTARLIVGPWSHTTASTPNPQVGGINFGVSALMPGGASLTDIQLAWFDHWLKDTPATDAHESGVLIFVMGTNQWRHETEWPLARAKETPLHLSDRSSLQWEPPKNDDIFSEFRYDPADPVLTHGGNGLISSEFAFGPADQAVVEARDDVLIFTSEPLKDDLEITGRVSAILFASTDGPSTDWVVRLCDVDTHGTSRNVVDGIARVQTEPDKISEVHVDLWSTSIVLKAGHRIRVQVTSSNFPRWDRNLNKGEPIGTATEMRVATQRVFHDQEHPSRIILPIIES